MSFSRWLCKHFKDNGFFSQRLEVTTGAGVPDLSVLGNNKTYWIELKWETKHIRPEQYIWGKKALDVGVLINYVVGSQETLKLLSIENAKKMSKDWKLTNTLWEGERTKKGIEEMIQYLQ